MLPLTKSAMAITLFLLPMAGLCQDQPVPQPKGPPPVKEAPAETRSAAPVPNGPHARPAARRREYTLAPALIGPTSIALPSIALGSVNANSTTASKTGSDKSAADNRVPIVEMGPVTKTIVGSTILHFTGQVERFGPAPNASDGANQTGHPVAMKVDKSSGQIQLFPSAVGPGSLELKSIGPAFAGLSELEFEPTNQSEARNYPRIGSSAVAGSIIPWGLENAQEHSGQQATAAPGPSGMHSLHASLSITAALGGRMGFAISNQLSASQLLHPHFVDPVINDRKLTTPENNPPVTPTPTPAPSGSRTTPSGSDPFGGTSRAAAPSAAKPAPDRKSNTGVPQMERGQQESGRPSGIITPSVNAPLLPSFAPVIDSTSRYYAPFRP